MLADGRQKMLAAEARLELQVCYLRPTLIYPVTYDLRGTEEAVGSRRNEGVAGVEEGRVDVQGVQGLRVPWSLRFGVGIKFFK